MSQAVELLQYSEAAASPTTVSWAQQARDKARRLGAGAAAALNAWAAARADAALYEALCNMTDAQLRVRGLSRGDLHRAVSER